MARVMTSAHIERGLVPYQLASKKQESYQKHKATIGPVIDVARARGCSDRDSVIGGLGLDGFKQTWVSFMLRKGFKQK